MRTTEDHELTDIMDAMEQGFLWLDAHLLVKRHNRAYRQLLQIENEALFVGRPFAELLSFLQERGEFAESGEDEGVLIERHDGKRIERVRPDGTVLSITAVALPKSGYLITFMDITRESRAFEEVRRNTKATVVAMANFAEHRDTDTGVHVLRVARLIGQTARELKRRGQFPDIIDDAYIDYIGTASILHDVGKISMPDSILLKAGPLSVDERATVKRHPFDGAQLLKQAHLIMGESSYLSFGAEIALTHHEWYDGTGYPAGLRAQDIPLSGRICAIADVFDALTSRRPYKEPWSIEQSVAQIQRQSGSQFDPLVVEAFLAVIKARETVSLVQWTENMSVGNLHIDEQHKILIDTINQLASAESQNDRSLLSMIIDELLSYTVFHFQYEEQLIQDGGYPELEKHRRIHQNFVQWVTDIREEFIFHRREQLGDRILNFLRDWLSSHILGEDQLYRPFIGT
jgi:hemerythrin-like metal-binding protein